MDGDVVTSRQSLEVDFWMQARGDHNIFQDKRRASTREEVESILLWHRERYSGYVFRAVRRVTRTLVEETEINTSERR